MGKLTVIYSLNAFILPILTRFPTYLIYLGFKRFDSYIARFQLNQKVGVLLLDSPY